MSDTLFEIIDTIKRHGARTPLTVSGLSLFSPPKFEVGFDQFEERPTFAQLHFARSFSLPLNPGRGYMDWQTQMERDSALATRLTRVLGYTTVNGFPPRELGVKVG